MKELMRTRYSALWMLFIFIIIGCNDEDSVTFADVSVAGVEGSGGATGSFLRLVRHLCGTLPVNLDFC